jgi:transcription elongation factor B subunit 1
VLTRRACVVHVCAGEFVESDGEIRLTEITTPVLEKVIEYFYYKLRYDNAQEIPEFPIDKDIAIPLLVAANFLNA